MSHIPLELYKQIHASVPIACVDVVVIKDEEVLLCHRQNKPAQGEWWFPGGRVLKGETLAEAAVRKMGEETGLTLALGEQLGTTETVFPDGPFGGPTHTINTVFVATTTDSSPTLDAQHDQWRWFSGPSDDFTDYVNTFIEKGFSTKK